MIAAAIISSTIIAVSASIAVVAVALLVWLAADPEDPAPKAGRIALALALLCAIATLMTEMLG